MAGSGAFEERDYAQAGAALARAARAASARFARSGASSRPRSRAPTSCADAGPSPRGELLYSTHCVACHTQQMHWRERKLATDWSERSPREVRRWQRNAGLDWSDEDVDAVARYLNATIYRFRDAPAKATG